MIWNRKKPYLAEITFSKLLSGKHSNKEIIHYEISLGDSGIYYEPGDSLAVVPNNDHNLALAIINRLGINSSIIPTGQHATFFETDHRQYFWKSFFGFDAAEKNVFSLSIIITERTY